MHTHFPNPVIACIHEGRHPEANELAFVAEKVWVEGISVCTTGNRKLAEIFARAALYGSKVLDAAQSSNAPHLTRSRDVSSATVNCKVVGDCS